MTTTDPRSLPLPTVPRYGVDFWREALASPALVGLGPYGPLGPPDIYGVRVPGGFRARVIGRSGRPITGTDHTWHLHPSDGATIATRDGGWVYVSNSQAGPGDGGASGIRFRQDGHVVDAYRVLNGTLGTRAGCRTPWGTWLAGETGRTGRLWECVPDRPGQGQMYPLAGSFDHGALAVDPRTGVVYLCENDYDGRLYRYRPDIYGDLSSGVLEAAKVRRSGHVDWVEVSSKHPERSDATTGFHRTDGAWFADDALFITSADARCVWAFDVRANELSLIYDAATMPVDAPMREPGTVTVHERSGDILVAEYIEQPLLVLLADASTRRVAAPFLELVGHGGSEIAGIGFDPTGTRLYLSSLVGSDGSGLTFEVTGPFRRHR